MKNRPESAPMRRDEPAPHLRIERRRSVYRGPLSAPGAVEETLAEQLLRLVRTRKWIIVQAVVLVMAATLLYTSRQEQQYTASANLLFTTPLQGGATDAPLDPARVAATNAALVQLPAVSSYAAELLDGVSAGEIYSSVTVDTGANDSDIATVSAVSASPERAADIANAYAEAYIDFRRDTERDALENSVEQLKANLTALSTDRQNGPEGEELRRQITALETAAALRTGGAELVQRATAPSQPSSPKVLRNVVLSGIVGIVLGLLLAALFDRLDRRLRTVEDLERAYALPVLAEIPRARRLHQARLLADASDANAEPFRMLRTNLRHLGASHGLRSLLVASPVRGDGKTTVAHALATTMAAMGDDVVLVEADLHHRPAMPAPQGLSTVLVGQGLSHVLVSEPVGHHDSSPRRLTVLPAGPPVPNPSELLESERMNTLLRELEESFEFVIVDGPATTTVSDALSLVPIVSGVLVVGGLGHTTAKAAATLRQQLDLLNGHAVGLVVNFAPPPPNGYGYRR